MENNVAAYYSLRYESSDALHKKGEVVVVPSGELRIGEQADCKVLFENTTDYEDELYAIVRPTRNAGEWQLIPASDHIATWVNGNAVSLVHYLNDGDRISFDHAEQELVFTVHRDDRYAAAQGVQVIPAPIPRRLLACMITLPLLIVGALAAFIIYNAQEDGRRERLFADVRNSVLQITVDSVYYMHGDSVLGRYSYQNDEGHVINGTAFLTADSSIVTARHCIQPWLNENVDEANSPKEIKSLPARWAMMAETHNQENDTKAWRVVAVCHFYRGQNGMEKFGRAYRSTEFEVDETRDHIVEKGDFDSVYYWRSVKETYSYKEMMLGDVAWTKTDSVGKIRLATAENLDEWLTSRQTLYFMGYPDHKTLRGFSQEEGRMQMDYEAGSVIAHSGNLIHGYSGAPAIVVQKGYAYAVGVVSRVDPNGGARAYSVPVNELKKKGGKK